jgi:hypothetical protein
MRVLAAFLLLLSLTAYSKEKNHTIISTDIHCFKLETILKELKSSYGEEPIFVGKSSLEDGVITAVYVNQFTGSYTVLETSPKIGCVLSTGNDMRYRMPKSLENTVLH